ncbi:MAG: helix-turn-helix domain-containing protein [Streptosporangiaceae bacterium]
MSRPSPTVRRRRLRYELRKLREDRGLTIDQVSEATGGDMASSTISRLETGDRGVRPIDLRFLLDIYEVKGQERDALLALCRQARERGWWHTYGDAVPNWFQVYVGLETEATSLHVYESELVHGLLQTPDYYRAFLREAPTVSDEEAERKIAVRAARQERLTNDDPPEYWAVLNEATIRRPVGGHEVMRAQLRHIAEISELSHVTIQVLPFSAGAHPAMDGGFRILGFPEPADPDVVYQENQMGGIYHEKPAVVDRYTLTFNHLIAKALDPSDSRALILHSAAELT